MLSIPYDPPSNSSSPTCSPLLSYQSLDTPQSSPVSSPHHPFLLPPPDTLNRSRSHSNASTSSWASAATSTAVTAPSSPIQVPERRLSDPFMYQQDQQQQYHQSYHYQRPQSASPSLSPCQQPCPSTSTSSSSSGDPVVKRKRGRPPNTNRQVQRDHWTFVTPTVWDVKRTQLPEHMEENQHDHHLSPSSSPTSMFSDPSLSPSLSSSSSSSSSSTPLHQESAAAATSMTSKNGVMLVLWPHDNNGGSNKNSGHQNLNTFTNTSMDTTLTMPKKKRGRKPKTQLAGNSCFVWRDLTAKRGANRLKTPNSNINSSTQAPLSSSSPPHLLPASRNNSRISKKQSPYPYAHSRRNHHHKMKTDADDIIDWTKDLSLNDRSTLVN
ncbi:unnamed protein product [Absidia cylindrospora]